MLRALHGLKHCGRREMAGMPSKDVQVDRGASRQALSNSPGEARKESGRPESMSGAATRWIKRIQPEKPNTARCRGGWVPRHTWPVQAMTANSQGNQAGITSSP